MKYWAVQLFEIFQFIENKGLIIATIRPKDILICDKGNKVTFTHLRGLIKADGNH